MSDLWTRQGDERLYVRSRPGSARLLIGLPFLAMGCWFLYRYLVMGIVEYIRAGDWAGLFSGVLGWLVILLMGGLFFVPGWLLVFTRRALLIDRPTGVAFEARDFLVYRQRIRHPLAAFRRVLLLHEQVKKTNRWLESVYLVRLDDSHLLVGTSDTEAEAERLAVATAELLGLPRESRSGD